jgi:hypothetical protein
LMMAGLPFPAAPPEELKGVGGVSIISGTSGALPTQPRSADDEDIVMVVPGTVGHVMVVGTAAPAAMVDGAEEEEVEVESKVDPADGHSKARARP